MDTLTQPSVFISYSRKDSRWLDALSTVLAPVSRSGIASVWWDRKIKPSQIWRQEIDTALNSARLAILLVSPNFLASDFIQNEELPFLFKAARDRGVKLLWVLVSPCLYELSPLREIQAAHDPSRPLSKLQGAAREEALVSIARAVLEALATQAVPQGPIVVGSPGFAPLIGSTTLHNLPYPKLGELFTGRQEDLTALERQEITAITQSAAISGLGGIGKTRLAVEYAWRHVHRYKAVCFVGADSPEDLRRNLAALANPNFLGLRKSEEESEETTLATVMQWLREHQGWLVILDNADTPEAAEAVVNLLPSLTGGRVLITSRLASWPGSVQTHSLEKLSSAEAIRFLLNRTENGRERTADDETEATALAATLDGLPLALEQAAAYILRHRMRFSDYLQAWEQKREELLSWHNQRVTGYPLSVAVTWKHTFDRLSPKAAGLLRVMAFLAPDPIPIDLFEGSQTDRATDLLCEETKKEADATSTRDAIAELADYSMIIRQDRDQISADRMVQAAIQDIPPSPKISVHRMVQAAIQDMIPSLRKAAWAQIALQIIGDTAILDPDNPLTWPRWDSLRPHVEKIVNVGRGLNIQDPTIRLMTELGQYLEARGLYNDAEPLMRNALSFAAPSDEDHRVPRLLVNLALLLQATHRLTEAQERMQAALSIDRRVLGSGHPDVAKDLVSLALILQSMSRQGEAEQLLREANAINEACFGRDSTILAASTIELARLLQATGRENESINLMRQALAIYEAGSGKDHVHAAKCHIHLGQLLQAGGHMEEAEKSMRRALEIDEVSYRGEHREVACDLINLGSLLSSTGRAQEAELLLRRALRIDEATFGTQHPEVAEDLRNLSQVLVETGQFAEAEALLWKALGIYERSLGSMHPEVSSTLNSLAALLEDMNRPKEAEQLLRRALVIDEVTYGNQHPEVAINLSRLARLLQSMDELEEAERLMRRAIEIDQAALGSKDPRVANRLTKLALILRRANRPREAKPLLRRALGILEERLGTDHPHTMKVRSDLQQFQSEMDVP